MAPTAMAGAKGMPNKNCLKTETGHISLKGPVSILVKHKIHKPSDLLD
jgi:hypothetical protein